jgi:hypothetical protein
MISRDFSIFTLAVGSASMVNYLAGLHKHTFNMFADYHIAEACKRLAFTRFRWFNFIF